MLARSLTMGLLGLVLLAPVEALACNGSVAINSCTASCSSNCYLLNNINCTDGQGIELNGGADLDMCGHVINCSAQYCVQKPALQMNGNNSRVYSSVDPATSVGGITGIWLYGIDCEGRSGSRVDNLKFTGGDLTTFNCAAVENNYFETALPVTRQFAVASDSYNDNHMVGPSRAVSIGYSAADLSIEHNLIEMRSGNADAAIDLSGATANLTVQGNVIIGDTDEGEVIRLPENLTFGPTKVKDNICEPGITDCANCRTNGYCKPALPGFVFP